MNSTRNLSHGCVRCTEVSVADITFVGRHSGTTPTSTTRSFTVNFLFAVEFIFEDENQDLRFIIVGFRELRTSSSRTLVHALCCVSFLLFSGERERTDAE